MGESKDVTHSCSGCGKNQHQVRKLIILKPPDHIICDECVLPCMILCFNENYGALQVYAERLFAEIKGVEYRPR